MEKLKQALAGIEEAVKAIRAEVQALSLSEASEDQEMDEVEESSDGMPKGKGMMKASDDSSSGGNVAEKKKMFVAMMKKKEGLKY